jgi:hypothetical protein
MLYGTMQASQTYGYRTKVAASSPTEAFANVRPDKSALFNSMALMGMEGLLRPFSTNVADPSNSGLPHYHPVNEYIAADSVPCRQTLDPFDGPNDMNILIWGQEYPGNMHAIKAAADGSPPDYANARWLGLRGPLQVVGWGYEYTGKPFPNDQDTPTVDDDGNYSPVSVQTWENTFSDDHRRHPEKWKTGPVALHYDTWRGCWTIPTVLKGVLTADLTAGPKMTIDFGGQLMQDQIDVYNYYGSLVKSGSKIWAAYYPFENKWYIISAQCPTV